MNKDTFELYAGIREIRADELEPGMKINVDGIREDLLELLDPETVEYDDVLAATGVCEYDTLEDPRLTEYADATLLVCTFSEWLVPDDLTVRVIGMDREIFEMARAGW